MADAKVVGAVGKGIEPQLDGKKDADKDAKFKEMKNAAAKRFKERRAADKAAQIEKATKFVEHLKAAKLFDKLTPEDQTFITSLTVAKAPVQNGGLFTKIFGENPKVGDSVTLRGAFEATTKGKSTIDFYCKKWAEKGIVVAYKPDAADLFNSKYVIEKLPN